MAAYVLASFWLWGRYEDKVAADLAQKYHPLPLPEKPTYTSEDVSVVVATIDTPDTFPQAVRSWLSNKPKEIIIVTIKRDMDRVLELLARVPEARDKVRVLEANIANKREQLAVGIHPAKGSIIALVDDDAFWTNESVVPYLLAGFEDPKIGASQGLQSAYIPKEKQHPDEITPWEVACIKAIEAQNTIQAVRYAADGGCFGLVGRTILMRAEILKNEAFLEAMCNEHWGYNKLNTGDDCFISRWIMDKGWKFHIQNAPEAELLTLVPKDSSMIWQLVRWRRSSFQSCLTILFYTPGFRRYYRTYPYCARKLLERFFNPLLTWLHIWAWISAFSNTPRPAVLFLSWYLWNSIRSYRSFVDKYPYCKKKVWGAILCDYSYPILDLYGWCTLHKEGWLTRRDGQ